MKKSILSFIIPLALFSLAVFAVVGVPERVGAQVTTPVKSVSITTVYTGVLEGYDFFKYQITSQQPINWVDFKFDCNVAEVEMSIKGGGSCGESLTNGFIATTSYFMDIGYKVKDGKVHTVGFSVTARINDAVIGVDTSKVIIPFIAQSGSITVLSPNGGETIPTATALPVVWTENYAVNPIIIRITDSAGKEFYSGKTSGVVGKNMQTLQPEATNVPPGKYKVTVCDADGLPFEPCDSSDNYFTIGSTTPCYTFIYNLTLGSRDTPGRRDDVTHLQNFLLSKGFSIHDLTLNDPTNKGYFGNATFYALQKYQTSVGIEATGYFGPQTRAKVNGECDPINSEITLTASQTGYEGQYPAFTISASSARKVPSSWDLYLNCPKGVDAMMKGGGCGVVSKFIGALIDKASVSFNNPGSSEAQVNASVRAYDNSGALIGRGSAIIKVPVNGGSMRSPITITNPTAGEVLQTEFQYKIVWTTNSLVEGTLFDITEFLDSGKDNVAEGVTISSCSSSGVSLYTCIIGWTPHLVSSKAQLAVSRRGTSEVGYSGTFSISSTTPQKISASITSSSRTTSLTPTITGTASGVSAVGLTLSSSGGKVYGSGLIPVTSGKWSTTVSPALVSGQYTVTVYDANNKVLTTGILTVVASAQPSITVLSPNGGENFDYNSQIPITWSSSGWKGNEIISVKFVFPDGFICSQGETPVSNNSYYMVPPNSAGCLDIPTKRFIEGTYKVRLVVRNSLGVELASDDSNSVFNIVKAASIVKITSPITNAILKVGDVYTINWSSINLPSDSKIMISLFKSGTAINKIIVQDLPASQGTYAWKAEVTTGWAFGFETTLKYKVAKLLGFPIAQAGNDSYNLVVSAYWSSGSVGDSRPITIVTPVTQTITVLPWTAASTDGFTSVLAGNYLGYSLNWSGGPMGDPNYMIFVHFVNRITGVTTFWADINPTTPVSSWSGNISTPNGTLVPANTPPGTYDVYVGIYRGPTRLALTAGPGVIAENDGGVSMRYKVGSVNVTAATPTANVSSAGLPLVRTPNASASIWNALKSLFVGQ